MGLCLFMNDPLLGLIVFHLSLCNLHLERAFYNCVLSVGNKLLVLPFTLTYLKNQFLVFSRDGK